MRKLKLPGRDATRPRLEEHDIEAIEEIGLGNMEDYVEKMVDINLKDPESGNIPGAGNPVYKAMHACNTSSRAELSMAHKIPSNRELNNSQIESVTNLLTRWIVREYNFYQREMERKQKNLSEFR